MNEYSDIECLFDQFSELDTKSNSYILYNYYSGLICTVAVTTFEGIIKSIVSKYKRIFENNQISLYKPIPERLNARIKTQNLKDYLYSFSGSDIYNVFLYKDLSPQDDYTERTPYPIIGDPISSAYDSIISSRHEFIHNGQSLLSLNEALEYYQLGKKEVERFKTALIVISIRGNTQHHSDN